MWCGLSLVSVESLLQHAELGSAARAFGSPTIRMKLLTSLELLILGLGPYTRPLSPETRKMLNGLGIRTEIQDTRNAAAQFNLLATERGVGNIAAALIPMGRQES